ncbi:MAG: family 16 glycoside hydrolase [Planctomycetota bacterium]
MNRMIGMSCLVLLANVVVQANETVPLDVPAALDPDNVSSADRGPIFKDDFEGRDSLGDGYVVGPGMDSAWRVVDGVLLGKQVRDDHGSVMRKQLDFQDIVIEFKFRFSGGSRFNFVIDDKQEKSVHAGHICRVSISPKKLTIGDDKTGTMNLEVRARRKDTNLSPEKREELAKFLEQKQASAPTDLRQGKWYHMRVSIHGDRMDANLDGKLVASLRSPGIAHPTKTQFGMTVNGSTIDFDDLKVFVVGD